MPGGAPARPSSMRFINDIFPATPGREWRNAELLPLFEKLIGELPVPDPERGRLLEFVRFQLVGERSRYSLSDWGVVDSFQSRAEAFEHGADHALDLLAEQVAPAATAAGVQFDAIVATTATGNLMPGISYRMAQRLDGLIRPDSMLLDLANVGCTGGMKALNLVRSLDPSFRRVLVVSVEVPSTLRDFNGSGFDLWQGNCTFGDGAAALVVTDDPETGSTALALENTSFRHWAGPALDLIRWTYRDYYAFALDDESTFDRRVRDYVTEALQEQRDQWTDSRLWAVHPAGLTILVRISRKLGIPQDAIQPSIDHYRRCSNQSSAGILQILKSVAAEAEAGESVNMVTMGAGFNVVYGRVRKIR